MASIVTVVVWLSGRGLVILGLVATSWALGRRLTRVVTFRGVAEQLAVCSALGLAALGGCLFLLGLLGRIDTPSVIVLLATIHLAAGREWRRAAVALRRLAGNRPRLGRRTLWIVAAAVLLIPLVMLPLYPAGEYDSLVYHLPYAAGFIASGELPFFDDLVYPLFPTHQELLFAAMMLLGGEVDAQLVNLLQLLVVALLVFAWGRQATGSRGGILAAALWLGTPLAVWHGGTAYVDLAVALYGGAAIYTWWRRRQDETETAGQASVWAMLAAAFAAAAAAVKYVGLFFPLFIGATLLTDLRHHRRRRSSAAALALVVVLTAPWYLRTWAVAGNPLFPFYPELFGSSAWADANLDQERGQVDREGGVDALVLAEGKTIAEGLGSLALVPYDMVFRLDRYGNQAPLSPWLLLLLPTAGLAALARPQARGLLLPVALYSLAWLVTTREPRFLLAVLPPLAVALVCGLAGLCTRWRSRGGEMVPVLLAAGLLLPGPAYALYKLPQRGPVPVRQEARESYLRRQVPGYAAVAWLNGQFGCRYTAYAWHAPWLVYHAQGKIRGALFGPFKYRSVSLRQRQDRSWGVRQLRSFGVDFLIHTRDWYGRLRPLPAGLEGSLHPVASGAGWEVFAVPPAGAATGVAPCTGDNSARERGSAMSTPSRNLVSEAGRETRTVPCRVIDLDNGRAEYLDRQLILVHGAIAELHELYLLPTLGRSPAAVLAAATVNGARCLKQPARGTVQPGKRADLNLWSADPLALAEEEWQHLERHIAAVALNGKIVG